VSEPILEQIAQYIKGKLDELVDAGEASEVSRPLRAGVPTSPRDKSLVLIQLDPTEDESPMGRKSWVQPFEIEAFVVPDDSSTTPADTLINRLRSQIEKKVRENPNCGGLATDLRVLAPELFTLVDGGIDGVTVNFTVFYRTLEDDPYTQG